MLFFLFIESKKKIKWENKRIARITKVLSYNKGARVYIYIYIYCVFELSISNRTYIYIGNERMSAHLFERAFFVCVVKYLYNQTRKQRNNIKKKKKNKTP